MVLCFPNENLIEPCASASSTPSASNTCEGSNEPDEQAEPDDTAIPARSRLNSIDSPSIYSKEKSAFDTAYANLIASRKMKDGDKEYLVYDDFEKNNSGNRPFGVTVFEEIGEPDGNVYREGELSYLALRAFKLQSKVQKLTMGYTFTNQVASGNLVMEARVRFNEAKWADIFRVQNESGQDAIVVAIERISSTESCIVAYHNTSKKILATYKTGEWVDVRLEIDVDRSVYNVFIDGEKANEHTFRFRNKSEALVGVTFGVKNANTDLNIDRICAYTVK